MLNFGVMRPLVDGVDHDQKRISLNNPLQSLDDLNGGAQLGESPGKVVLDGAQNFGFECQTGIEENGLALSDPSQGEIAESGSFAGTRLPDKRKNLVVGLQKSFNFLNEPFSGGVNLTDELPIGSVLRAQEGFHVLGDLFLTKGAQVRG